MGYIVRSCIRKRGRGEEGEEGGGEGEQGGMERKRRGRRLHLQQQLLSGRVPVWHASFVHPWISSTTKEDEKPSQYRCSTLRSSFQGGSITVPSLPEHRHS